MFSRVRVFGMVLTTTSAMRARGPLDIRKILSASKIAILLADKIFLMSNGPRARIAEVVVNTMPKTRTRENMHHDPQFYRIRNHLVDFLVHRSRQIQEAGAGDAVARMIMPGLEEGIPAQTSGNFPQAA